MNPLLASVFKLRSGEQKTQSGPGLSNTLNRVMHAPLEAILGNEITLPPLPKKMRLEPLSAMGCDPIKESSFNQDDCGPVEIPNVLQGEVARLQPQFKVSLDPGMDTILSFHFGGKFVEKTVLGVLSPSKLNIATCVL